MPISYEPMREYMKKHNISYYYLGNNGIDPQTQHRIRHDEPLSTKTLEKLCKILDCQPVELLKYTEPAEEAEQQD